MLFLLMGGISLNKNQDVKKLVKLAMVAGIYAALTIGLAPISYLNVQFRISEILVLLVFMNSSYTWALTVGCFIANMLGPNGIGDVIFGTLATFISCLAIIQTKKYLKDSKYSLIVSSIWPSIINGLIIGLMLNNFYNLPLVLSILEVMMGEFVVVTIIGVPFFSLFKKKLINLL